MVSVVGQTAISNLAREVAELKQRNSDRLVPVEVVVETVTPLVLTLPDGETMEGAIPLGSQLEAGKAATLLIGEGRAWAWRQVEEAEPQPGELSSEQIAAMEQIKFETARAEEAVLEAQAEAVEARADAAAAHGLASEATVTAQDAHNAAVDAQDAADTATQVAGDAQAVAEAAAQDAADAAGIAGAKADVLIQSGAPAAAMQKDTTLWIDTTGGANTPKRWDGNGWVVVTDKAATDAASAAASAQTTADNAATAANNAQTAADNAQAAAEAAQTAASNAQTTATNALTSANGRNSRVTSTNNPSGTTNPNTGQAWVDGDTWWKWDNTTTRNVIGAWTYRNGSWEAEKIGHETISSVDVNKLVVSGSADIDQAVINKLVGNIAMFDAFVGETFIGGTFTGTTFRSVASGQRVQMDKDGLRAYNASGATTFSLTGGSGSIEGFTITGGTVRTASTGARVEMSGDVLSGYASSNRPTIQLDTAYTLFDATEPALVFRKNIGSNWIPMVIRQDGITFLNPTGTWYGRFQGDGSNLRVENAAVNGDINIVTAITGGGSVRMNTNGGIYQTSRWQQFDITGTAAGSNSWAIRPISIGGVARAVLQFMGGGANMPQTTIAANVLIDSNGNFYRTSSARRFKRDIQDVGVDPSKLLDVPVRDWIDATQQDMRAEAELKRSRARSDKTRAEAAALLAERPKPRRTPGVVAEEVEAAGLDMFVTYDNDGETAGVMYDRLPLLLIPLIRDLRDRITTLEEQHG